MLSGDPELAKLAMLRSSEWDGHTANAAMIFGVSEADLRAAPDYKTKRHVGKITSHGAQRDMRGDRLSGSILKELNVLISPDKCNQFIERYHARYPAIRGGYFLEIKKRMMRDRCLANSWGRVMDFKYDRLEDSLYREAYSFLPQCVDEATEVLTPKGFQSIGSVTLDTTVAQWEPSGVVSWTKPLRLHDGWAPLVEMRSARMSGVVSTNHRVVFRQQNTKAWEVREASKLLTHQRIFVPANGWLGFGPDEGLLADFEAACQMRVIVSAQADATRRIRTWEWHLSRPRKIERLRAILDTANVQYKERQGKKTGTTYFWVKDEAAPWLVAHLTEAKRFDVEKLLTAPRLVRSTFLQELLHWDGRRQGTGGDYIQKDDPAMLDVGQAVAVVTGMRSTISDDYRLNLAHREASHARLTDTQYVGRVVGVTVPSGFFIARRKGTAYITGNSECADLMNQWGLWPVYTYMKSMFGYPPNVQVHDSLLCSVKAEDAYDLAVFIKGSLERPRLIAGRQLLVPVEFKIGINWSANEKLKEGMEFKELPSRNEFTEVAMTLEDERRRRA